MAILHPSCLTDINRLQSLMSPSASFPAEDQNMIIMLINSVSRYIARMCKREFKYKSVSNEDADGRGQEWLKLNYYPIISVTSIYDDVNRLFTATSLLTEGTDFEINNANAGIIRYLDGTFASGTSNVRSTYVAGYSEFQIVKGSNDQIDFNDGVAQVVTLDEGAYNAVSLASHIQTKMDAASTDTITSSYSSISHKFTIASDGASFALNWLSAANARSQELGKTIGFVVTADDSGGTEYTADYPGLGIPDDLADVCESYVRFRYSIIKEKRESKFSESSGDSSSSFDTSNLPNYINEIVQQYRIRRITL